MTAWEAGITGNGSIIAVIDSGIDEDSPEFAGRIHPDSADVASNRGIDAVDDHGTNVAMVAAAARDDAGILGIAFDAQVLVARADDPGTCAGDTPQDPSLECQFDDRSIAAGVDLAVASGANVVNISLGGGGASPVLTDAVSRAAAAGVVVIVSAGNDGDGSTPGVDPNEPDPFASSLLAAGAGHVIIVGSVDENGTISDFSNRAGSDAQFYLSARGEAICCVYENGQVFIETTGGQQFVYLFSGTSFSAPQVSGAVALLAQAFPNLTGAEIVEILLDSARDAGAAGTDTTYGRGILDIAAAIQPSGTTTLAGGNTQLALYSDVAIGSAAMGDGVQGQSLEAVILDKYDRAYTYDLAARVRGASIERPRLRGAVEHHGRALSASTDALSLAFNVGDGPRAGGLEWAGPLRLAKDDADKAELLAMSIAARIAPDMKLGIALNRSANGLVAQLQGQQASAARPAFLIASEASHDSGFDRDSELAFGLRREIGDWGLTFFGESGDAFLGGQRWSRGTSVERVEQRPTTRFGIAADREIAGIEASLALSWLNESETVLGGYFHSALGGNGADTGFVDMKLRRAFAGQWEAGASWRQGVTMPRAGGLLDGGSRIVSNAWSFDLSRRSVFGERDRLGFRVSQPLRVASGGLELTLPVAYDYATESAIFGSQRFNLAPEGREMVGELAWSGPLLWGNAGASLFYRREPGHFATAPDDVGAVVKFNSRF